MISRVHVDQKIITTIVLHRPLLVVRAQGAGLPLLGTTAAMVSGAHDASRIWSRALWSHPAHVDGIQYRCRHDDDQIAVALYYSAANALESIASAGIRADRAWFGSVLDRYNLALVD